MSFTVNFSNAEAQELDNGYDDGNLSTGAFKTTNPQAATVSMLVDNANKNFATFKQKYCADIDANKSAFKSLKNYMALYNHLKTTDPQTTPPPATTPVATTPSPAAEPSVEAIPTVQGAAPTTTETTYEYIPNSVVLSVPLGTGEQGLKEIPATYFEEYLQNQSFQVPNGTSSETKTGFEILHPFFRFLYKDVDDQNYTLNLDAIHDSLACAEDPPQSDADQSWFFDFMDDVGNWWQTRARDELLGEAGGDETKLEQAAKILKIALEHFQAETKFVKFSISEKKADDSIIHTYQVQAFVDSKGLLEVKIFQDSQSHPSATVTRTYRQKQSLFDAQNNPVDFSTTEIDAAAVTVAFQYLTRIDGITDNVSYDFIFDELQK